jgi:hypothetical protein
MTKFDFDSLSEAIRLGCNPSFLDQEIAKRACVIYRNRRDREPQPITVVISRCLKGCLELEGEAPAGPRARTADTRIWEANAE